LKINQMALWKLSINKKTKWRSKSKIINLLFHYMKICQSVWNKRFWVTENKNSQEKLNPHKIRLQVPSKTLLIWTESQRIWKLQVEVIEYLRLLTILRVPFKKLKKWWLWAREDASDSEENDSSISFNIIKINKLI